MEFVSITFCSPFFADTPNYVEAIGVPEAKDEKQENFHIPMYPTFKN